MSAPVEVTDLRFAYPDGQEALAGVSLRLEAGQRTALVGPNGAGKSTLALHLNGIHRPAAGQVRIGDLLLADDTVAEIRRRVGLVLPDPDDQLFMPTVGEDVAFGPANLGLRGRELDMRVEAALVTVGAADLAPRAPHHLSDGEKRRVALATVLAMEPDVLVLDEPTAGLDPRGRRRLIELLAGLEVTQLVATHDLALVLELCERTVIMDGGRIVADGPTPQILADADLLAAHGLEALTTLPGRAAHRFGSSGA